MKLELVQWHTLNRRVPHPFQGWGTEEWDQAGERIRRANGSGGRTDQRGPSDESVPHPQRGWGTQLVQWHTLNRAVGD
jgi:hypothetical protein